MILISYLSLPVSLTWTAVFIYSYILPEYAWTFVLQVCQGSLCKRIGYNDSIADTFTPSWDECYISGGSDVESRKKMCYLACQKGKKKTAMCPCTGLSSHHTREKPSSLLAKGYMNSFNFIEYFHHKSIQIKHKHNS